MTRKGGRRRGAEAGQVEVAGKSEFSRVWVATRGGEKVKTHVFGTRC